MNRRSLPHPLTIILAAVASASAQGVPKPLGVLVDLGGHRLHVNCGGKGPTVIVENGFDEFSFDWTLVQRKLEAFARVCVYDRAGYAWSDPGPAPRTFDQMNLELHDALKKLGESGPYVFAGHGFGGPVARNFAYRYPTDVAGLVLVDAISEDQRFEMWHRAVLMRDGAKGKPIPAPHEQFGPDDKLPPSPYFDPARTAIEPPFDRLAPDIQELHRWAQIRPALSAAEENERTWSPEYFSQWHDHPERVALGALPLIVLMRQHGAFHDLDITAERQESERQQTQRRLASLSTNGDLRIVSSGEHVEIEDPATIVQAVLDILSAVRGHSAVASGHGQQ